MLLTFTAAQLDEKCLRRAKGYREEVLAMVTVVDGGYQIDARALKALEMKWRPPALAAMIGSLALAAADAALSGFERRAAEQVNAALDICARCEFLIEDGFKCGRCGCALDQKVKLTAWHCPLGKW